MEEGGKREEGRNEKGREGGQKQNNNGRCPGRQAFFLVLSLFLVLVLVLILILLLLILAIVILQYWGVDLPYLSQEIPDDFTFGTRYMYVYTTMYYDT